MSCVVSIHALGGELAGAGVIVAPDLVLTCAHVVNYALRRADHETRPSDGDKVKVQFEGAPGQARDAHVDQADDAWSAPPADAAAGADICILRLEGALPLGAEVGRVSSVPFKGEFAVRVNGYPRDFNKRASRPQLDAGIVTVLERAGYLWLLRADAGTWAAALATGKRAAGQVYSGFSGGPLQVGEAVVGIVAEARENVREATAYATPAYYFPARIVAPSPRQAWLAAHCESVVKEFTRHMAASQIRSGLSPQELYLDLVVTERRANPEEKQDRRAEPASLPVDEVLRQTDAPLLLIGEGGAGKSTALQYMAARAAERLNDDPAAPVPVYVNLAKLTKMEGEPDLLAWIAGPLTGIKDWQEFADLEIDKHHRILFLFDSFNEVPEPLQRSCATVLQRFVAKQRDRHTCLIASRAVAQIEQLARPPSSFRTFELLRLTPDRVQGFLQRLGLGALYDRMPGELRELAGNPFMLLAVARTLASATTEDTLPRRQGHLYQRFAAGWMRTEADKRALAYSYELVKEPFLAFLAKRMTSAGETSLALRSALDEESTHQLKEIADRSRAMPVTWTIPGCLEEILHDGLLKQANDQLFFIHQSVQEYFTALSFLRVPDELVKFVPRFYSESASTYHLADVPNHRLAPPLLMMVGLMEDATKVVEALAIRNPILAARALSSANNIHGSLVRHLEQTWLDLLEHGDLRQRALGCSSLALASLKGERIVKRLVRMAVAPGYEDAALARLALKHLNMMSLVANQVIEITLSLGDEELEERKAHIGDLLRGFETGAIVGALFERWRQADGDGPARPRLESMLATVRRDLFKEELQRISIASSEPAIATAADRLTLAVETVEDTWGFGLLNWLNFGKFRRIREEARKKHSKDVTQWRARLERADESAVSSSLRSLDPAERMAAAEAAAERRMPMGEQILESLLLSERTWGEAEVVAALVSLWNEQVAVSKLMEAARRQRRFVAHLPSGVAPTVDNEPLSEALKHQFEQAGISVDLVATERRTDGAEVSWSLEASSSWGGYRRLYQLEESAGHLTLYDCNGPPRAFQILAQIPGDASLVELRRAVEHEDPRIKEVALEALSERRDPYLPERLLVLIRSSVSDEFVSAALKTLRELPTPQSASLINDLLEKPQRAQDIHNVLVPLGVDDAIQAVLDRALSEPDETRRTAAADELRRWFLEAELGEDRASKWRTAARLQHLLQLVLFDPFPTVQRAAADALRHAKSEFVLSSLADALSDDSPETRVRAAEALIVLGAQSADQRIGGAMQEAMQQIARASPLQDLRLRAGKVLGQIPGGMDDLYLPVRDALTKNEWRRALQLSEVALEIAPDDVDLLWWRGHALRGLGEFDRAADSHVRAAELMENAPVIPQALALTFLDLGDPQRAREAAQKAVNIDIYDADSQSMLAWCSYRADDIDAAEEAARMAVNLDPVHADAIWIAVLVHLRRSKLAEARSAFEHALKVRELLSPGLNTSFMMRRFLEALDQIGTGTTELSQLFEEIKGAVVTKPKTVH